MAKVALDIDLFECSLTEFSPSFVNEEIVLLSDNEGDCCSDQIFDANPTNPVENVEVIEDTVSEGSIVETTYNSLYDSKNLNAPCFPIIFPPAPPPEEIEVFLKQCRGDFREGFPREIAQSPYKYVLKVVTTLPEIYIRTNNKFVQVVEEKRERIKLSDSKNEFQTIVQFRSRIDFQESEYKFFKLEIYRNDESRMYFSSDYCLLKSKRGDCEREFWRGFSKKRQRENLVVIDTNPRPLKMRKLN